MRFQILDGVAIYDSLPFGLTRLWGVAAALLGLGQILTPQRHFIQDFVDWEESLGLHCDSAGDADRPRSKMEDVRNLERAA